MESNQDIFASYFTSNEVLLSKLSEGRVIPVLGVFGRLGQFEKTEPRCVDFSRIALINYLDI